MPETGLTENVRERAQSIASSCGSTRSSTYWSPRSGARTTPRQNWSMRMVRTRASRGLVSFSRCRPAWVCAENFSTASTVRRRMDGSSLPNSWRNSTPIPSCATAPPPGPDPVRDRRAACQLRLLRWCPAAAPSARRQGRGVSPSGRPWLHRSRRRTSSSMRSATGTEASQPKYSSCELSTQVLRLNRLLPVSCPTVRRNEAREERRVLSHLDVRVPRHEGGG